MCRLVCAFVVRKPQKTGFLATVAICERTNADMQSSKVFFYFYSFRSIENQAKGGKSPKIAPKMQVQREAMEENAANIWEREATTIAER